MKCKKENQTIQQYYQKSELLYCVSIDQAMILSLWINLKIIPL